MYNLGISKFFLSVQPQTWFLRFRSLDIVGNTFSMLYVDIFIKGMGFQVDKLIIKD